ncbi:MAG: saccharopine dehydrogenase NADP-binding domain-containing protein [Paracoccaceae bacterium]|nr:saccharopine dehydrogenase NADP-binding domain-containing protein [Paracoccaceae bacterium]
MSHIHWVGTGLSAIPGIKRLIENGHKITVWNRTIEKAQSSLKGLSPEIQKFSIEALNSNLNKNDILISMLPGDWHVPLAKICLQNQAHFVSSSYISPEMLALNSDFKAANLACVNEVGLDPGIDHSMAHFLVNDLKNSLPKKDVSVDFISYCGGVPKIPNPFRYKFSWSPAGVLKALKSPSKSIKNGEIWDVERPWDAITRYTAPLPEPEEFEVYPNRDSLPFIKQYHFNPDWHINQFVRGTLRLDGWSKAWSSVFNEIENLTFPEGDARLQEMSNEFWVKNAYEENEPDRVILCVSLSAKSNSETLYHKSYVLDAWGTQESSAMARLVSIPVATAVEAIKNGEIKSGVTSAPDSPHLVDRWMTMVESLSQHLEIVDHLK